MRREALLAALILTAISVLTIFGLPGNNVYQPCALADNAAWISVDWTSQPVDPEAIRQLANDANRHHLKYLYPFTTYVKETGFSPSYTHARDFVTEFRKYNTETQLLAWVGVPLKRTREFGIPGWVDLSNPSQRSTITTFVAQLVRGSGFDGVHLNVETVWNNDPNYLIFLEESRATLGDDLTLSVATSAWLPQGAILHPAEHRWDSVYYRAVASRVDQIATMTYDSQSITAGVYQGWLEEQIKGINSSVQGLDTDVLIGLSISREETFTHHAGVENMENALPAICQAARDAKNIDGAAIYAAWEATPADWAIWDQWLR